MLFDKYINGLTQTKKKVLANVFWALLGKVVTLFSSLIVGILVARSLGPDQFGIMNYVISVVSLFSILASFGMYDIVIRELARADVPQNIILGTAFGLRMILSLFTILGVIVYSLLCEEQKEMGYMMIIYSIYLLFACFDVIRCYFTSIIQNKRIVISEVSKSLLGAIIKLLLIFFHAPLPYFIGALTLDFVFLACGYFVNYQKVADCKQWKFKPDFAVFLIKCSFPLLIAGATATIYQRIDQVLIAKLINNASVGYFSTALSFVGIAIFIPIIMIQTLSPLLVEYRKNNPKRYAIESQRVMNVIVWVTILICGTVSLLSYPIIRYSYGMEYIAAVPVMQILVFKAVGIALTMVGDQLILIENIHKYAFIRNILACIVCVVSNYLLIPVWGIIGSAWATIITVLFSGGLGNLFIPPYHHILRKQCISILFGWKDLFILKNYYSK